MLNTSTDRTTVLKKVLMSLKSESLMKLLVKLMRNRDCEMKKAITKKSIELNILRLILVAASQKLFPSMGFYVGLFLHYEAPAVSTGAVLGDTGFEPVTSTM